MNTDNWITAVLALRKAKHVVVFTGAGISAESGIPTFRDADGFWQRFPPEQFATWTGLLRTALTRPQLVAEFVLNVVEPIAKASPNAGHLAVAELEKHVKTSVVTQNIDGLHQSAGSTDVHEIHGSLLEVVDTSTAQVIRRFERNDLAQIAETLRQYATHQISLFSLLRQLRKEYPFDWLGRHRPNLVLFGDAMAEPAWTERVASSTNAICCFRSERRGPFTQRPCFPIGPRDAEPQSSRSIRIQLAIARLREMRARFCLG